MISYNSPLGECLKIEGGLVIRPIFMCSLYTAMFVNIKKFACFNHLIYWNLLFL